MTCYVLLLYLVHSNWNTWYLMRFSHWSDCFWYSYERSHVNKVYTNTSNVFSETPRVFEILLSISFNRQLPHWPMRKYTELNWWRSFIFTRIWLPYIISPMTNLRFCNFFINIFAVCQSCPYKKVLSLFVVYNFMTDHHIAAWIVVW